MSAVWLAAGLLFGAVAIVTFHDIVLVFFAAAVFAIPLRATALRLGRALHVPVAAAIAVEIVCGALVLGAVVWMWESLIAVQVRQLAVNVPNAAASLIDVARREPWASRISAAMPDPGTLLTGAGGLVGALRGVAGGTLAALVDVAILVFVTVCFAIEPRTYVDGALRLVTPSKRAAVDAALQEAADTIGRWLRARVVSMFVIAVLVGAGLRIAGIPDAAALAMLAGIFAFVPNVGALVAALPSLLLAAPLGWQRVVLVVVIYWCAHALDDVLVIPIAERRIVRLPPALTIGAQVVLGLVGGAIGIMMAAPFVAVSLVLVRRLVVDGVVERGSTEPVTGEVRTMGARQ